MKFEVLTQYLDSLEDTYHVPGLDCIILKDHEVIFRHQHGYSDYEKTHPVDGNELYYLYSCTKIATMTACMQLEEKGMIHLDDPVSMYLPCFQEEKVVDGYAHGQFGRIPDETWSSHPAKNPILLKHLMSMTAGLSYNIAGRPITELQKESNYQASTVEMMDAIAALPLLYEPGTGYGYSLGHDVMAAVVEIVSGERFSDYLLNHIFLPLGTEEVYFDVNQEVQNRMIAQYSIDFKSGNWDKTSENRFKLSEKYESGGAGLISSVDSYSLLLDALACGGIGRTGKRILSEESIIKMRTPFLTREQVNTFTMNGKFRDGYSYALGVRVLVDGTKAASPVGEFGWDGAAGAYAMIDPINHISLFYAQEVLGMIGLYENVHPKIRDLLYQDLKSNLM